MRRKPIPQVIIKVDNPDRDLKYLKSRGYKGFKHSNGDLWIRGTLQQVQTSLKDFVLVKELP